MLVDKGKIHGKKFICALPALALIIIALIGAGWFAAAGKEEKDEGVTITALSIEGIGEKFQNEDEYYLTVDLEDWLVDSYHLPYDRVSFKTRQDIYDKVVPGEPCSGVTLKIADPERRQSNDLIGWVMKERRHDLCEIISVSTAGNHIIGGT